MASSESRLAISVKTEKCTCLFTSDCILEMSTEMCTVQFVAAALFFNNKSLETCSLVGGLVKYIMILPYEGFLCRC